MKILITGANGLLGLALARHTRDSGEVEAPKRNLLSMDFWRAIDAPLTAYHFFALCKQMKSVQY
jgi:dTDP-4-dehydrorhamnose reductase